MKKTIYVTPIIIEDLVKTHKNAIQDIRLLRATASPEEGIIISLFGYMSNWGKDFYSMGKNAENIG